MMGIALYPLALSIIAIQAPQRLKIFSPETEDRKVMSL
jgi:hypothetical protein